MSTPSEETPTEAKTHPRSTLRLWFSASAVVVFFSMGMVARGFHEAARIMPLYISFAACALAVLSLVLDIIRWRRTGSALEPIVVGDLPSTGGQGETFLRYLRPRGKYVAWILGFFGLMALAGTLISVPVFVAVFLRVEAKVRWTGVLIGAVVPLVVLYVLQVVGQIFWPPSLLLRMLGI